jgi:hypothetical protein
MLRLPLCRLFGKPAQRQRRLVVRVLIQDLNFLASVRTNSEHALMESVGEFHQGHCSGLPYPRTALFGNYPQVVHLHQHLKTKGTTLRYNELIQQLQQQFAARVSRHHARSNSLTLSEEEAASLANSFPSTVLLEAFRRAGSYTKQHPHTEREVIFRVLKNIAKCLLDDAHARGKHTNFIGTASQTHDVRPASCPAPTDEDIYDVQREFQESVTAHMLDSQWTLYEFEAAALLANHSVPDLRRLFDRIGKWVLQQRTKQLIFHDQDSVTAETFKIAHTSQPTAEVQR